MVDTGKIGSVGKVNFHTNDHAWTFLGKYKGTKFTHGSNQLWHTWDRPKDGVLLSKRVLAIKTLRTRAAETGVLTVWFKKLRREESAVTIHRRPHNTSTEFVYIRF